MLTLGGRVWTPFAVVVVSQATAYGALVSSAPRAAPSRKNWTPATPTLSAAVAVTDTGPETVAPLAGAVMLTLGGVVSALATVTLTAADVVGLPAASRAREGRVWGPFIVV